MLRYCLYFIGILIIILWVWVFMALIIDFLKEPNKTNSSAIVTCVAEGKCRDRHTKLCINCKYNRYEEPETFYKPKKYKKNRLGK